MEFITFIPNRSRLQEINEEALESATLVEAAVAYVENERHPLLVGCWNASPKIPLRLWGRYDSSVPVSPLAMRWFLDRKSADFTCRLIPDYFHAKVIWWHGYGAYVGSANLSSRAWDENREAGAFLYLSKTSLVVARTYPCFTTVALPRRPPWDMMARAVSPEGALPEPTRFSAHH